MTAIDHFSTALRAAQPGDALRQAVLRLADEGREKPELYQELEALLLQRRQSDSHSEADEEIILDVMDALSGWCHPSAEILPDR